jgi:5-methylcytosine-specific restriction enzyme subunit McrC
VKGFGPVLAALEEIEVVESKPAIVDLTEAEVDLLLVLGRELASSASWWGGAVPDQSRSVIAVEAVRGGRYRVIFRDVIGVVKVGTKQIKVSPKIPMAHFMYIANRSDLAPRLSPASVQVDQGDDFALVLARWCVYAAEKLVRHGLRKDYTDVTDAREEVQGRILPMETALLNSMGVLQAVCEFQDFSDNTSLNRVVKAACQRISRIPRLDQGTRAKARKVAFRMDDVGTLRPHDLRARVDRLSTSYSTVLPLALLVLSGLGVTVSAGRHLGTAFLVRTPELIEDGLRSILESGLVGVDVSKRRLMLGDSGLSINPDLVFGESMAVGDVKYRALGKDWSKPDLNQIITFATGFRASWAAVFGFSLESPPTLPRRVAVGEVSATAFCWVTSELTPDESAARLVSEVEAWAENFRITQ